MNLNEFIVPLVTSVASSLVAWGVMHTKVGILMDRVKDLEQESKEYISHQHFQDVTTELKAGIKDLQNMMNQVLLQLSKRNGNA